MSKNLDLDDRERNVIYIDAREYNKNKNTYTLLLFNQIKK